MARQENQVRTIRVISDVKGEQDLKKLAASLGNMNKEIKKTADGVSFLKNLTGTITGVSILGFGVRELTDLADSMTQLSSRLRIFVGEGEKSAQALRDIIQLANDTKSPITDVAEVFSRIATSTARLNIGYDAQIALARILQQSFRLSGSTAAEATAATIQFSQALSFGQLRGQELRSVLSQNAVLAGVFSKAIEGSGKDIYKFAEAGGFTTKFVLNALAENFDEIDAKANTMSQTFSQTLTLAMNQITVKVDELNRRFKLNEGFAALMDYIIKNGDTVAAILITLGATALPAIVAGMKALTAAIYANPLGAIIGVLTFAFIELSGGIEGAVKELRTFPRALGMAALDIVNLFLQINPFANFIADLTGVRKAMEDTYFDFKKFNDNIRNEGNNFKGLPFFQDNPLESILDPLKKNPLSPLGAAQKNDKENPLKKAAANLKELGKALTIDQQIGALNRQFNRGNIELEAYNTQLERLQKLELNQKLEKGEISLKKFHEEMRKNELEKYARLLDAGQISMEEFSQKTRQFNIDTLNDKFRTAKITAGEFYNELAKLKDGGFLDSETYKVGVQAGLTSYIESLGTLSSQIADVVKGSFNNMEDAIFEALQGSTRSFADFANAVLNDLTRIAIRMAIIKPIAQGFGGFLDGLFSGSAAVPSAAGAGSTLYQSPIPFASGGIVDSPTYFGFGGNKMGKAGERGSEAILPLQRDASGNLGVAAAGGGGSNVTVNVINNSGSDVQTRETRDQSGNRTIDIMVESAVNKGFASGKFDRALQQSYGLNRKGG